MKSSPVKRGAAWQRPDNDVCAAETAVDQFHSDCTESTAKAVALHRSANGLRDDEAEPHRLNPWSIGKVDDRVLGTDPTAPAHGHAEVVGANHPVRLGEHSGDRYPGGLASRCERRLRGQLGAALGATCSQDAAAGAGAHTKTEAVHLGALAVVRLEGSLAHSCISKYQLLEPERCGMPEGGSQLVKNTGLNPRGQTTAMQPTILHMLITGVGKDTRVRTKVKRVAQFPENPRHETLPASYTQWITLLVTPSP